MSGLQIESKGNRMVLMFPKSVEFQVRCVSLQMVVIQQFVVSIYLDCAKLTLPLFYFITNLALSRCVGEIVPILFTESRFISFMLP